MFDRLEQVGEGIVGGSNTLGRLVCLDVTRILHKVLESGTYLK